MMQWGDIQFQLRATQGLSGEHDFRFAVHETPGNKPKSQFMGAGLSGYTLQLYFHRDFCVVEDAIDAIKQAAAAGEARELVFDNGRYLGDFYIEKLGEVIGNTLGDGLYMDAELEVSFKEYNDDEVAIIDKEPETGDLQQMDDGDMGTAAQNDDDLSGAVRQEEAGT
ncbi:MAG TPA: phage tail protein [bacterium]|nr:phage tail protein [bacterium]